MPSTKHNGSLERLNSINGLANTSRQEANWYKPEPGQPYRPLVAMPAQLRQRVPWLSFCEDIAFTAYDPPIALSPATALGPSITPGSDPKTQILPAVPSPTTDPGPRKTYAGTESLSVPRIAPAAQMTPSPGTQSDSKQPSGDPEQGNEIQQDSDTSRDPRYPANLNVPGLQLQPTPTTSSNQESDQIFQPVAPNQPHESGNEDPTGRESRKEAADVSQVADPDATTPADTSDVLQRIRSTTASHATTANPVAAAITVIGIDPEDPGATVDGTPGALPQRILTTIAGHAITAAPAGVAIAGTSINPGDPGVTIGGTQVALNKAGHLVVGSKTIPLASVFPETITTAIAGKAITADPTAIVIAGTTLRRCDPAVTADGTAVALDKDGSFLIGSKKIPFRTESATPVVTTIAGQVITAASSGIAIAGTTLRPGDASFPINGTVISLNTAGRFVVGSKTYSFKSESVGLDDAIAGASGAREPRATLTPLANQSSLSVGGKGNATSTSVQIYKGEGRALKCNLLWMDAIVAIVAMVVSVPCFVI